MQLCASWVCVRVCMHVASFSKEHFKRAVCYPGPLCFKDGWLISKVWMLWKSYHVGLHLNFLQLKITFLLLCAPQGQKAREKERERESTATKGEVSVEDGFGVAEAPVATPTCPNLSSPGRVVINYWATYTGDTLSFIECHTPDLGNKSLGSKQTRCGDTFRLLIPGWQLSR